MKISALAGVSLLALSIAVPHARADGAKPMFAVQPLPRTGRAASVPPLPLWTFTWSGGSEQFVGTNPAGGAPTTIPVYIIPVKVVYGTTTEDPLVKNSAGQTPISSTVASPLFNSGIDYVQGGTDLGTTQYIDAFQRASLWSTVATNPGYHVLYGTPTVTREITFTIPKADGNVATEFGVRVVTAYINTFDADVQNILKKAKIPAGALPIFVTSNVYLTELPKQLCCIGGYHSYNNIQTYVYATYIPTAGAFAQDVSALSHELGEWIQDPLTNNAGCGGLWETGDPLENEANYGDYSYPLNGFTYHLQDLVLPPYFGVTPSEAVNSYSTFQGTPLTTCQNGQ